MHLIDVDRCGLKCWLKQNILYVLCDVEDTWLGFRNTAFATLMHKHSVHSVICEPMVSDKMVSECNYKVYLINWQLSQKNTDTYTLPNIIHII